MAEIRLAAEKREISTKGAINQLRRNDLVPGVFYSKENEPIHFSINETAVHPLIYTTETNIVVLELEGKEYRAILKDAQFDPVSEKVLHIDLHGLKTGENIQIEIPIQLIGTAKGIKAGGRLDHSLFKLQIECLPKDIPSNIEVDITELGVGDSIHVSDLNFENLTILTDGNAIVASVSKSRSTTEEEAEENAEETETTTTDGE